MKQIQRPALAGALACALLIPLSGPATGDPGPTISTTQISPGIFETKWVYQGSELAVQADQPLIIDQSITINSEEDVSVVGGIEATNAGSPPSSRTVKTLLARSQAAAVSGDLGCGGVAPLAAWPFNGKIKDYGTFQGALVLCKDSVSGSKAFILDKMWMSAKGESHILTETIPDTFWVQAYAPKWSHPALLEQDPINSIADTAGACTSASLGISGNVASVGIGTTVCRGTESPIFAHDVSVNGTLSHSYGINYEGKNLLMDPNTTYGAKGVGWRSLDKQSKATPYYWAKYRTGMRYSIDFDKQLR
jgi:hypothetical protein